MIEEQLEEKKEDNHEEKQEDNIKKEEFKKEVKSNLQALRDVGFRVYHNIGLE